MSTIFSRLATTVKSRCEIILGLRFLESGYRRRPAECSDNHFSVSELIYNQIRDHTFHLISRLHKKYETINRQNNDKVYFFLGTF